MIRTQIFFADLSDLKSALGSHNEEIKKQILSSLGYGENDADSESDKWRQGVSDLIDEANVSTAASQIAFNRLPKVLHIPTFSEFADWEDAVYWDLAQALEEKGVDKRLVGYLKMLYSGRRIDQTDQVLERYASLTETDSLNNFADIPRHSYLTNGETQELIRLLKETPVEDLDEELQEFITEELKPALAKSVELGKGLLFIVE